MKFVTAQCMMWYVSIWFTCKALCGWFFESKRISSNFHFKDPTLMLYKVSFILNGFWLFQEYLCQIWKMTQDERIISLNYNSRKSFECDLQNSSLLKHVYSIFILFLSLFSWHVYYDGEGGVGVLLVFGSFRIAIREFEIDNFHYRSFKI